MSWPGAHSAKWTRPANQCHLGPNPRPASPLAVEPEAKPPPTQCQQVTPPLVASRGLHFSRAGPGPMHEPWRWSASPKEPVPGVSPGFGILQGALCEDISLVS